MNSGAFTRSPKLVAGLLFSAVAILALGTCDLSAGVLLNQSWPCGIVTYKFDGSMGPSQQASFVAAANIWSQAVGVKFVQGTDGEDTFVLIVNVAQPIDFVDIAGFPGLHKHSVLQGDFTDFSTANQSVILHELGHVIGFLHEHERPPLGGLGESDCTSNPIDVREGRNCYVDIDPLLIDAPDWEERQAALYNLVSATAYDCGSIMHYKLGNGVFPKSSAPNPGCGILMAQAETHLTASDIQAARAVYGLPGIGPSCQVVLDPGSTQILLGGTVSITANLVDSNNQASSLGQFQWTPNPIDGSIASVSVCNGCLASNAIITGNSVGTADIQVFEAPSGLTASATVGVIDNQPPTGGGPGCWSFASAGNVWLWNGTCGGQPPPGGGQMPPQGCWRWDPTVGTAGGWVYQVCGGNPSDRDPNPPLTVIGVVGQAGDPNDKQGAQGFGLAHYLSGNEQLRYAVLFQNVPTASAAARTVVIQDLLDTSKVDMTTLRLGPVAFGVHVFAPPPIELASTGTYITNLDLRPTENLGLQVTASFNSSTGALTWTLTTLDPVTGMPPADPLAGFLAPGEEGSVLFSVAPKSGTATNTELTNMATIVFDANPPIDTPVWSNLIDSTPPTSAVSPLPASEPATGFNVSWSGTDVGSGIRDFTIYASDNGGPFTPFQMNTTATSATFTGQIGHTYGFYSIARDLVGNVEAPKSAAEATTQVVLVTDNTPPTTAASHAPAPNVAGWNNSDVTITVTSADNPGGTGVKQINYSATGAQTIARTTLAGNSTSFTISTEGTTTITFFGTDNAGNAETPKTITIKLDKTPPSITAVRSPAANAHGWNNSDVTASFICTDAVSGLAAGSPPAPAVFSSEGANQSVSGACQDLAGNSASATVSGINIDNTPPTVACSASPNVLWPPDNKLAPVNAAVTVTDSLSGPAGFKLLSVTSNEPDSGEGDIEGFVTGTPSVSGQLRAQRLGSGTGRVYTLAYSAADRGGNSAGCTTSVAVPHDQGR